MQPTDSANHRLQETYDPWSNQDRSLPIVLTFFLLLFFLFSFFSLYLFRYVMDYLNTLRQTPAAAAAALRGLPTSVISSFPTFAYSSLKGVQHGNDRLECAVCLAEFSDDDMLRMLTGCSHVFHQECIDLWLETHTTCPVCRLDLDGGKDKKVQVVIPMPESNSSGEGEGEGAAERQERRNSFKEDGSREGEGEGATERQERRNSFKEDGSREGEEEGATERQECRNSFKEDGSRAEGVNNGPDGRRQHREQLLEGQLSRSHSTGHSTNGKFRLSDGQHNDTVNI